MRFRSVALLAACLLAASALAGVAQPGLGRSAPASGPGRTITVTGLGTVTTVPDQASFDLTVETRAASAAAALVRDADAADAVAAAVKKAGVAPADLQTSQVSLSPQTNESGTDVIGYVASDTVTVATSIARAGAVVDAAVGAGATGVSGPALSRSDVDALTGEALRLAVADAHAKAAALAEAAGVTLGGAQSIAEGQDATPVPADRYSAAASPTIEPGAQTIDATVTVAYAIS
jgi:uncharacterized protein